jgi:hypothetical protein
MSYDTCNLSSVSQNVLKFYQQLTGEERRIPFIFDAEKDAMIGTISAHPRGFGFVMLDEGGRDLRLSAHHPGLDLWIKYLSASLKVLQSCECSLVPVVASCQMHLMLKKMP